MKAIGVEEYIQLRKNHDSNINVKQLRSDIYEAIRSKLEGYRCCQCYGEMWAVGSVLANDYICSNCMGIEPNSENDIEFNIFLEKVY